MLRAEHRRAGGGACRARSAGRTSAISTTPSTPTSRRRTRSASIAAHRRRDRARPHLRERPRHAGQRQHRRSPRRSRRCRAAGYDGWLTIEAFGQALPDLAAATRVWRKFFADEDEVVRTASRRSAPGCGMRRPRAALRTRADGLMCIEIQWKLAALGKRNTCQRRTRRGDRPRRTGRTGHDRHETAAHPARHGRRRQGRLHRRRAPHRRAPRRRVRARRRRALLDARRSRARVGRGARPRAEARIYDDFEAMAKREARRKDGIEAVAIVTPNHMHAPAARAFLKRGIHVICDKPLTATLPEAKRLAKAAAESDALFVLTHNYTGYPMVRQARAMVADGRARRDPGGAGRVRPGLALDRPRGDRPEAGRLAHRPGAHRRRRLDRRHRHPRLQPRVLRHRPEARQRSPPTCSASCPAAASTTTATCCCASRAARAACSGAARSRPATRTRCGCGSTARRAASTGRRRTRTTSGTPPLGEPKRLLTRGGAGAGPAAARVSRMPGGPSRRLPRGLRHHLRRGGPGDPRPPGRRAGAGGRGLSDDRGRRRRRRLRRRLRALLGQERRLGHARRPRRPRGPIRGLSGFAPTRPRRAPAGELTSVFHAWSPAGAGRSWSRWRNAGCGFSARNTSERDQGHDARHRARANRPATSSARPSRATASPASTTPTRRKATRRWRRSRRRSAPPAAPAPTPTSPPARPTSRSSWCTTSTS